MSQVALAPVDMSEALSQAFPSIDCNHRPFGQFVVVQIRLAKARSPGGLILVDYTKDTETDNTVVGKVLAIGPGAFKNRTDGTPWPEGPWFAVGDYVRCPKYGGDRWKLPFEREAAAHQVGNVYVPATTERGEIEFAIFKDLDLRAGVDAPLQVRAYV